MTSATTLTLQINGQTVTAEAEPRTLLVDFIRRAAGQTGTHVGCDTSQCGACTVILQDGGAGADRRQIKCCAMLAHEAADCRITTIEGLVAPDGTLSRMQRAFRLYHGLQCGFCTPGMIMSATALLETNPRPTEAEVRHHIEGNICRCTGYHNIIRAILAAADPENPLDETTTAGHAHV